MGTRITMTTFPMKSSSAPWNGCVWASPLVTTSFLCAMLILTTTEKSICLILEVHSVCQSNWMCQNCTYINSIHNHSCSMCEYGWTGMRECPSDKWECMGCTFYNPKTQFYCEVCDKARADLASVRF